MKKILYCLGLALLGISLLPVSAATPAPSSGPPGPISVDITLPPLSENYALGPDSLPQPGVPKGKVFNFQMTDSKIFPSTDRTIKVYIPAQYQADKPACLMVFFGGLGSVDTAPTVFDNLIAQHAMPVTIGVAVTPGQVDSVVPAPSPAGSEDPRYERSMECNSMTNRMPRFVLEEVLPEVEKHTTPDGKPILISTDPNDRAVGGNSNGGIAAFNLAWQRPDSFHRVFTSIAAFVGQCGGEHFYVLVRKTEPKPLRVFMEDGVNDECASLTEMGDFAMSNQTMERALEFAGYDVNHCWGAGGHTNKHAAMIFPDAMRWLWKDWPTPIQAMAPGNPALRGDPWAKPILVPGEGWQVAANGCTAADHLVADTKGQVFFQDNGKPFQISDDGKAEPVPQGDAILAVGPDGKTYGADSFPGMMVQGMTVRNNGDVYAATGSPSGLGELWVLRANGQKTKLADNIKGPSGLAFSPNGLWLFVAQAHSRWGLSYRVGTDGTLDLPEPFYDFWVPDDADDSGAGDICMDVTGRPYVATPMGVQAFDRNGRVDAILPLPGNEAATSVCFGGAAFDTLYATCDGKVYKRKLKTAGAPPWAAPIKLPHWGPG